MDMTTIESASTLLGNLPSLNLTPGEAETLAGPFFGLSLFPYLAFLYFLDVPENETPKGVTIGFATCLLFVFLTIPAAIASQVWYGVSLADSDWLHGSAESLLTMTNLVTATSYAPMVKLVAGLTALAGLTAFVPAVMGPEVHTPYLGGFMDLPKDMVTFGHDDPSNSLTIAW
jgi:hypothetical protein